MRRGLGWVSLIVLAGVLALTAVATWATRSAVSSQEDRLLSERANEVKLVLSTALDSLSGQLNTIGGLLQRTHNSQAAFDRATESSVSSSQGTVTIAVLRKAPGGYRVVMANGDGLHRGQLISDERAAACDRAMTADTVVSTPVIGTGSQRLIGFAVGPPATPPGVVVYQQSALGPLGPPRAADTAPFSEVQIVLYDGELAAPGHAVVSTARSLPLTGRISSKHLSVGNKSWLLQVRAVHPLVGGTTTAAPWFVLAAGLVLCVLLTVTSEIESRRRANAVALYRAEHRMAEELQRGLLPELPSVDRLEVAARYLAGTAGLQVGGDWYDVFPVGLDRIGIVIGDVGGHDISASATMSRVQAALRAYAFREDDPAAVLDSLDMLIESFQTERLVTVFYGLLDAPDASGTRELWYSNAGHPPPLVRRRDGGVEELDAAMSMLLGVAPGAVGSRPSARTELADGSTLILFTDGLIEVPGESMTKAVERVKSLVVEHGAGTPDTLCDEITRTFSDGQLRDDVALLVIQIGVSPK
ncbi:MAG: serine/threonine-protein phosphatase [Frankiaceae bacterium]|nr:serine/threonine-protein phosphatase [Frankiaceae bacterium]MBV9870325.1 serine/threonine-protein phosphatase [Frankiaceae bacterium]